MSPVKCLQMHFLLFPSLKLPQHFQEDLLVSVYKITEHNFLHNDLAYPSRLLFSYPPLAFFKQKSGTTCSFVRWGRISVE